MIFFEEAIKELWAVRGRKDGIWFRKMLAKWDKAMNTNSRKCVSKRIKTLKEISKLTGYPVSFLRALLKYEKFEEVDKSYEKKRYCVRGIQRTRK